MFYNWNLSKFKHTKLCKEKSVILCPNVCHITKNLELNPHATSLSVDGDTSQIFFENIYFITKCFHCWAQE